MIYTFDRFELDRDAYQLRDRGQVISLEPQVFELLAYLVAHWDRVVPKEELLDAIWGTRFVSESALTTRIKEARRALGDDGRTQKLIRTVVGRGYQLAVDVIATGILAPDRAEAGTAPPDTSGRPLLVGRQAELALLHGLFGDAAAGQRRVALVGGDAGEGKTSLLEVFLEEVRQHAAAWLAVGHAVDHTGPGEPYLPLLDALARLCRQPRGHEVVTALRRHAPTWLVQLPGILSDEDAAVLRAVTLGVTQERMLREIVEGIEQLCEQRPVVLVLEDLHWSDRPTLEVIAALARRTAPARLLLVATYRPGDPDGATAGMVAELAARRPTCHRLVLEGIDDDAVAGLIGQRLDATTVDPDLAAFAARRGGRNPLFITTLIEDWAAAGLLAVEEGAVVAPQGLDSLADAVPGDLRLHIQHQTSQLPPEDRELLRAASVVGTTAAAAAVAAAIDSHEETVEARLHDLARRSNLLSSDATAAWQDGTITSEFRFRHSLHQEVLYDAVPAAQRARFHGRVGHRLAAAFGADEGLHAADLAHHFVRSGDASRAVPALLASAAVASRRSAHSEAVELLTRAQSLVGGVRDRDERIRHEANILATLAPALVAVHGWAAPEVQDTYERALELCHLLPEETPFDAVLYGLATLHEYRAEYGRSQELTEQRLQRDTAELPSATRVEAHELLACSSFHQGGFEEALQHAETAVAVYDPHEHLALMALHGENPGVSSRHWAAHALWFLGYPDRALAMIRQALELAGDLAHSFSMSHAHEHAAYLHQYRLEPHDVLIHAEATLRLATEQGYPYRRATGTMLRGWARATDDVPGGLDELARGLEAYRQTGAAMDLPYFLALLADLLIRAERFGDASSALDEARSIPRGRGYYYEPELLRLRAEVLRRQGFIDLAKQAARRAIEVARAQRARSLELRAALAALDHADDDAEAAEARTALESVYVWFTEGFDTPDLQRARAALGD